MVAVVLIGYGIGVVVFDDCWFVVVLVRMLLCGCCMAALLWLLCGCCVAAV